MRPLARAGVLCGATALALAYPVAPLLAAAGTATVTAVPSAEAWYRSALVCAAPLPCAAAPTTYPAGTLHVGVTLGREDSRSYLQLDLTRLPVGTKPIGGQLRLPLAPDSDGTSSPETAKLRACLAMHAVEPADGSTGSDLPKVDCDAASVDAVFVPAAGNVPAAFTVDLASLATAWQSAAAPGALALLPGEGVAQTDRWHLTFNRQSRTGTGLAKPTAAISYTGASVDTSALPAPAVTAPVLSFDAGSSTGSNLAVDAAPPFSAPVSPTTGELPRVAAPQAPGAGQSPTLVPASFTSGGFRYPGVFLLPLLFAVAVMWLGRAFTRDLHGS
jgi:hypothetical protein